MSNLPEPVGQTFCPVCESIFGRPRVATSDEPHYHTAHEVELERYCRPAFEKWVVPIVPTLRAVRLPSMQRAENNIRSYAQPDIERLWTAFHTAWISSDALIRKPRGMT